MTATIQGELERVIGMFADADVSVIGSGRTDAGVHAEGQVANVHLQRANSRPKNSKHAINGNMWRDIRIMKCEKAPDEFHARFSAKSENVCLSRRKCTGNVTVLAAVCSSRIATAGCCAE